MSDPVNQKNTHQRLSSDTWERPLKALRISVTDRCNLRCQYCMPEENYVWLPRETLLTFEEISHPNEGVLRFRG